LAQSAVEFYYIQEGVTFSFRESSPGKRTNTYRKRTTWDSSPYKEGHLRFRGTNRDHFLINYRFLSPIDYRSDYSPGYPLVVMLHGAGSTANCWEDRCLWATKN